jgi:hypothetical protein
MEYGGTLYNGTAGKVVLDRQIPYGNKIAPPFGVSLLIGALSVITSEL